MTIKKPSFWDGPPSGMYAILGYRLNPNKMEIAKYDEFEKIFTS